MPVCFYDKLGYVLVLIISVVFIAAVFVVVLRFVKPGVAAKIEYIAAVCAGWAYTFQYSAQRSAAY